MNKCAQRLLPAPNRLVDRACIWPSISPTSRRATTKRGFRFLPSAAGDAYHSSRILLPDLAHRVAGANPLAMVPARGALLLASGNDVEFSVCTWSRGVDSLLPRTDRIAMVVFGEDEQMQEYHLLPWDALRAACADLMQPVPGAFPERYRVTGFPDLEVVRTLAIA
ncbi:hypothetical protein [uncultured Massilia sp.]|uniref:hypothetical protein n=1 Tax=uncultured Massilia sp. TaxID=169973 RepID=UPI002584322D|nr:hypothetical protein [uncultured Massilia sp.]